MNTAAPPPARRMPRRLAALIEQAATSGANLLAFVVLARQLSAEHWGVFGFAYAVLLFAQGFQRALVTIPMIPFTAHAPGWAPARMRWARANTRLVLVAAALLALLAAALQALGASWPALALAMATLLLPLALAQEFARRAAVQEERFGLLALMGLAYALPMLLVAALGPTLHPALGPALHPALGPALHPAWMAAAALGSGLAGAALLYRVVARQALWPWPRGEGLQVQGYGGFAGWALGSHLGYSGYNFGIQALLAAVAGPAAVGAFHACRTLVQPVTVLQLAMDNIDKPRAAAAWSQQGAAGLKRVLWRSLAWVALPSLPFLAVVALAAGPLLVLLYGPTYAGAQAVVAAWCGVAACSLLSQPVESGLYVARRPRALFVARALAALASLAAAWPLVQAHGAAGALWATALGFALAALFGTLALRRLPAHP
jgi:O-antigen/teichoic acid export membrane protein